jgi:hypothetical protein
MVLGAKHFDQILTQLSRESQAAARLISHELPEILRKGASDLRWDRQILVFLLPQPTKGVRSTCTEPWSIRAVRAGTMQYMISPKQKRAARHPRLDRLLVAWSSIVPP